MAKARAVAGRYPFIERRSGVRGGVPVIAGTGIRVLDVAIRYEVMGMAPEEILVALPHLTLPEIHAALSYYYTHKTELDKEWKASLKKIDRLRKEHPSVLERKLGQIRNLHR
ncbi:MAG TPA: DUF433 domain-containing protein [Candidatus Methylomirabilis sp.]